jgi:NTE family protein
MAQFRNLVFEGGGVKAVAYAGAVSVLEEEGILQETRRVAGTSGGAISAALLASGADSEALEETIGGTDFRAFMDDSLGVIRDTARLLQDYGWCKGDAFSEWMREQIKRITGEADLTFGALHSLSRKSHRFKELYVVGTNLTQQQPVVYSAERTADVPIWKAVRVSMSIPLFFACVRNGKDVLVDGGLTWNYPIDIFDDTKYFWGHASEPPPARYDNAGVFNKETLGLRVDTFDEIRAEKEGWLLPPAKIDDFFDYLRALTDYVWNSANNMHLREEDWHRTIAIDASGVKATDFSLSAETVTRLVANGCDGARRYFEWFNDSNASPAPRNRIDQSAHEGSASLFRRVFG